MKHLNQKRKEHIMQQRSTQSATLTQEELKEIVSYDPDTGKFTKLKRISDHPYFSNTEWNHSQGYCAITIKNKNYFSHRLAWLYVHGKMPKEIDHINGVRNDNRICNLRECNRNQNNSNKKAKINSKSGVKGVRWNEKNRKWIAEIGVNSRSKYLGSYENIEDAKQAYQNASITIYGQYSKQEELCKS